MQTVEAIRQRQPLGLMGWLKGLRLSTLGLWLGALLVLGLAIYTPLTGARPDWMWVDSPLLAPLEQFAHPLGTDDLGRDVLARLSVGAQISLSIGFLTALVAVGFGGGYGLLAALSSPRVDALLLRLMDVIYSLPGLMVVLLFALFLKDPLRGLLLAWGLESWSGVPQLVSLVLALALFSWPDTARLIRAETQRIQQEAFVEAFENLGGSVWRLIRLHLLPNLWPYLLLSLTLTVPRAILTESTLSFIGLGVEPPMSSWGTLASDGWTLVRVAPWLMLLPGAAITGTMLLLNAAANRLQTLANPRSSE